MHFTHIHIGACTGTPQRHIHICMHLKHTHAVIHTCISQTHTRVWSSQTHQHRNTQSSRTHKHMWAHLINMHTQTHVFGHLKWIFTGIYTYLSNMCRHTDTSETCTHIHMHTGVYARSFAWVPFWAVLVSFQSPVSTLNFCFLPWGHGYLMICLPLDFCNDRIKHGVAAPCDFFTVKMIEGYLPYPRLGYNGFNRTNLVRALGPFRGVRKSLYGCALCTDGEMGAWGRR